MNKQVSTKNIHSVKAQFQARLRNAREKTKSFSGEQKAVVSLIQGFVPDYLSQDIADELITRTQSLTVFSPDLLEQQLDELEIAEKYDWQFIANTQEQCMSIVQSIQESVIELREIALSAYEVAFDKLPKSPPQLKQTDNQEQYTTAPLAAMQTAIQKFWLEYDASNIPTQKAVSNFIAEQLGKPIRDRFTDELARAIKPDHL